MMINTKRLYLRRFEKEDVVAVLQYMTDPKTSFYMEQGCLTKEQVIDFVLKNTKNDSKYYAIIETVSGLLIGHFEFYPCFGSHTYEIGWIIQKEYQRRGYAFEGAQALITNAFLNLGVHRVIATCQPENHGSYHLMEKLGMEREGYFRQCIPKENGEWWDEYAYAILKEDFNIKA